MGSGLTRSLPWLALIAGLAVGGSARAQQAVVYSYENPAREFGQAFLTHHRSRCLAVLPSHVVAETQQPAFRREGAAALLGDSLRIYELGDDMSVAELSGAISRECGYGIDTLSRAVMSQIRKSSVAFVRWVNGDGTLGQLQVAVVDNDGAAYLRVQPTHESDQLRKGLSGSLLVVGDVPIGMLLSVDSRFGVGRIVRFDALLARVDALLASQFRASASGPQLNRDSNRPSTEIGRVVAWSVDPISIEHRASNLVASDDSAAWVAKIPDGTAVIEIELKGGEPLAISGIEFDGTHLPPGALAPHYTEIFVNASESTRRWRPVWSGALNFINGQARASLAPVWARDIKVRVLGDGDIVGLYRIRALER